MWVLWAWSLIQFSWLIHAVRYRSILRWIALFLGSVLVLLFARAAILVLLVSTPTALYFFYKTRPTRFAWIVFLCAFSLLWTLAVWVSIQFSKDLLWVSFDSLFSLKRLDSLALDGLLGGGIMGVWGWLCLPFGGVMPKNYKTKGLWMGILGMLFLFVWLPDFHYAFLFSGALLLPIVGMKLWRLSLIWRVLAVAYSLIGVTLFYFIYLVGGLQLGTHQRVSDIYGWRVIGREVRTLMEKEGLSRLVISNRNIAGRLMLYSGVQSANVVIASSLPASDAPVLLVGDERGVQVPNRCRTLRSFYLVAQSKKEQLVVRYCAGVAGTHRPL